MGSLLSLVWCGLLSQSDGGVAPRPNEWIFIDGEKALPEEVYRAVLSLPPDAGHDMPTAARIVTQLTDFLHRSGYELAEVDAQPQPDGGMHVAVNEGQLNQIRFRGRLSVQTVRFKLALDIPHDV